ncbi:glycoside hydrolase family 2 TIM barrel-domain containing protein [Oleiharenicola lentus]|uniref:glycoside hydrolase family 2 TIM barrel-domain containing protein n=1 Tax=Oleiharenicola lentus TaxID=2508720 RepID=UPI003F6620BD
MMPRFHCFRFAALVVFISAGFYSALRAQPKNVYAPTASTPTQSLDGEWQFRYYEGSKISETDAKFNQPGFFDTATWKSITVPGHWELQDFAEPKYGRDLVEGTGLYRQLFRVPPEWNGQRIMLRFEGVLYGYEVWVNGKSVGTWASGFNPATFDITDHVRDNLENILTVRVSTRVKGWEFDTNDCWSLSGIYRGVTLFAVPPVYLEHYTARTTLGENNQAWLELKAEASGAATLTGRLLAADGTVAKEFVFPLEPKGETALEIPDAKLWTAETPNLYTLELTLSSPGQKPQVITEKIGLREVGIVDGVLQLNGVAIKLRGVNHHDIWPDTGRTATIEQLRRDLELILAANCNFLRTAHYPPDKRLIALCDELGLYVMDEVPFGYGDEHLTKPDYQDVLFTRARATVRRDENHPSVIVWSIGNENPNTPLTLRTGQYVKELDPSRPICFPQVGSYFAKTYSELPEWVDIYAPHYPVVATVRDYATKLDRPIIHTEYAHALGLATDRIQDEWAIMQTSPHHAGGAVWMFQDQGILRRSDKRVEDLAPNPYVWTDPTHYYDTHTLDGMDGLTYADRTPSVDYWQVRSVYAPVKVWKSEGLLTEEHPLLYHTDGPVLEIANLYDFRTLEGFTLEWRFVQNGSKLQTGLAPLKAKASTTDLVPISLKWPKKPESGFHWLELRILNEKNISIHELSLRVTPPSGIKINYGDHLQGDLRNSRLKTESTADSIKVKHARFMLSVARGTGEITLLNNINAVIASGFLPHASRKFTEAERLRGQKESIWSGAMLAVEPPTIDVKEERNTVTLYITGRYTLRETNEQIIAGTHVIRVDRNGSLNVIYDFSPETNATGQILEAGFAMSLPATATEFRWIGDGPYAGYPGKDALNRFGRYHLTRDDLSFQGNRRGVELATLTQTEGTGVALLPARASDVAVERTANGILLSHNAVISGPGNKGGGPETFIKAAPETHIAGQFTLVPLEANWPKTLRTWLGEPNETAQAFAPFSRSYDQ